MSAGPQRAATSRQPMRRLPIIALIAVATGAAFPGFQEAYRSITAGEIRAHLLFLASDRLEGRKPGTQGADIAADYIAERFESFGLEPVGGSYFHEVPLTGITTDPATASLAFEVDDARLPASYPSDAVIWPGSARPSVQVGAELVFVGYGVHAPEWGWDDYKGRDVQGRVLLILPGDPPAPPDEPDLFHGRSLTYYGRWTYKLEEARRRGATGALLVHAPRSTGYPWDVVTTSWTGERLTLDEDGLGAAVLLQGWLTEDFARQALALAGLDLGELTVRAARHDFAPTPTGMTVRSRMNNRSRPVPARNVVGYIPGRSNDVVVFTAHYDHLGIGPAVDGDSIYNGAYDNASGVSVLLEVADAFARLGESTERGVLFMATTAEEAGLLGAHHYVNQPLFPVDATAAVINFDGANLWGETHDVIAPGVHHSTLGAMLRERAAQLDIVVRPDPVPERGAFFRSDHFPFARAGVPALYLQHGLAFRGRPAGWGDSVMGAWLEDHYHRPSDEVPPDMDLSGAVQQARLAFTVGLDLANAPAAPTWLERPPFPLSSHTGVPAPKDR